jgi:hypothetical protein
MKKEIFSIFTQNFKYIFIKMENSNTLSDWLLKLILIYLKRGNKKIARGDMNRLITFLTPDIDLHRHKLSFAISQGYIERFEEGTDVYFILTKTGDDFISPTITKLTEKTTFIKGEILTLSDKHSFELIGDITGMFFYYKEKTIFRFHLEEQKGVLLLHLRFPNLVEGLIGHRSNEFFLNM